MSNKLKRILKAGFLLNALLCSYGIHAQGTFSGGIIGGESLAGPAYAALVSPTGAVQELPDITNFSINAIVNSVAINNSGFALLGGQDFNTSNAFAAVVSPSGNVTFLPGFETMFPSGTVQNVAVSNSGLGVLGGQSNNQAFAAVVDLSTGAFSSMNSFPANSLTVDTLAINDSNQGLIGGSTHNLAAGYGGSFAAIPPTSSTTINIFPSPPAGTPDASAINNQNVGIIGSNGSGGSYVAAVTVANGVPTVTNLTSQLGVSGGTAINSAAINESNTAFIGGQHFFTGASFAGYVNDVNGVPMPASLTSVNLGAHTGVATVSMDEAGNVTAGGFTSTGNVLWQIIPGMPPTVIPVTVLPSSDNVVQVSINSADTTLVTYVDISGNSFVALLSPPVGNNPGTLTILNTMMNTINSVSSIFFVPSPSPSTRLISTAGLTGNAAKFANYLNNNVPNSQATQLLAVLSGSALKDALNNSSFARNAFSTFITSNILFGVSELIASHLVDQRFFHTKRNIQPTVASLFEENDSTRLTADVSDRMERANLCDKYSFWVDGFGEYNHFKSQEGNPSFNAYSGAALMGFDFYGAKNNLFGLGGGYAYTHLIENDDAGKEKINYYIGNIYDTLYFQRGYVELGVWGAYTQVHNYRHISFPKFDATASATIKNWQLVPHFGFGVHSSGNWTVEFFGQFDCAINWQQSFHEHGAGPFDMRQESKTSELLRSEGGFRFYQSKETSWGAWMIYEKLSYVNLKTIGTGRITAAIVGTPASLTLETFRGTQNLGSAGLEFLWRWGCSKPVTFSFTYEGEMGSNYMAHEGMVRLMKDF